jgi:hypothetical protein
LLLNKAYLPCSYQQAAACLLMHMKHNFLNEFTCCSFKSDDSCSFLSDWHKFSFLYAIITASSPKKIIIIIMVLYFHTNINSWIWDSIFFISVKVVHIWVIIL